MLDHPEKTARLLAALKAAAPFEVELMPALIHYLQEQNVTAVSGIRQTVWDVSYAGDEGGTPLVPAVLLYQKHRVKKLKKQGQRQN
jgi:hypothetical protein